MVARYAREYIGRLLGRFYKPGVKIDAGGILGLLSNKSQALEWIK
jgi:hypothetical protein